ncbi:MAG: nucleoside 2-deoxyribosyltransferase [Chloroflexi bacterium]|nr:nucleoside 2-deoxyribosyltransferase [Chloroflexota bacterium]
MADISKSTRPKPIVFVLMPFDSKFNDIYQFGIKGAADDVGAYAERVDEQKFSEGILDRIFNQINKADVIVADMTGRNPNVFYEVGYAHALGKLVLLLTQNADDIPFDLKHRQHTVYAGKIETLRKELATTLQWAIEESRARKVALTSEHLSVTILEKAIPEIGSEGENPTITGTIKTKRFVLPIHIRNDSLEVAGGITHVYLFTSEDALYIPIHSGPMGNIESFKASAIDAEDGLVRQYRLEIKVPSLPPSAVEFAKIHFEFQEGWFDGGLQYRLRLHTPTRYHDYRFRINIEFAPPQPSKIDEDVPF